MSEHQEDSVKRAAGREVRDALRAYYNRTAHEREASQMEDWKIEERAGYLSLLRAEGKKNLLEIGAGTGRDSKFFQDQGLEVVCIDLSPAMVTLCLEKGLAAHVMDMAGLTFDGGSFDAVYSFNSLLHIPKAEFRGVLQGICRVLRPGGIFYAGLYGGFDHEGIWANDRNPTKRFFSFWADTDLEREMAQVFAVQSFRRVVVEPGAELHFQSVMMRNRQEG